MRRETPGFWAFPAREAQECRLTGMQNGDLPIQTGRPGEFRQGGFTPRLRNRLFRPSTMAGRIRREK